MITSVLSDYYKDTVVPQLKEKRGYKNPMEIPKLVKIVINTGVGTDKDREVMTAAVETLGLITGQKPVITKSRVNVSNFKLRKGMAVGASVTLRRGVMYNFLYRLINIVLPRVRDFRGISPKSFDGVGNYNFGLTDQSVFTEIDLDKIKHTIGMNITIVTTAKTDDEARDLLTLLGPIFSIISFFLASFLSSIAVWILFKNRRYFVLGCFCKKTCLFASNHSSPWRSNEPSSFLLHKYRLKLELYFIRRY